MAASTIINVFIEISKGSHIKYEYDPEKGALICDRILHTPFKYSFNYGFVPNTLSEDGDPLDVVVLMDDELVPGCYIKCKILGYLATSDDEGNDPKLIACPIDKVSPTSKGINNISDIDSFTLSKIKYFFEHYKDLENKKVSVGLFYNSSYAENIYEKSVGRFLDNKSGIIHNNKITNYFPHL